MGIRYHCRGLFACAGGKGTLGRYVPGSVPGDGVGALRNPDAMEQRQAGGLSDGARTDCERRLPEVRTDGKVDALDAFAACGQWTAD